MECPRCGNTKLFTKDSRHLGSVVERIRWCENTVNSVGCGKIFKTVETINLVEVFNPDTLGSEYIDVTEYKKDHLDSELEGRSGFQGKLFRE